jgi:thioredoxin 1
MELLKFSAEWCGPCKALSKIMKEIDFPYPVTEIDIDEKIELASKYSIRSVPTLILIDEEGFVVKRISGILTKEKLSQELGI